jgi:hypothetical protein
MSVLAYVLSVQAYVLSVLAETVICSACTCKTAVVTDTAQSACKSIACMFAISAKMLLSNPWHVAYTLSEQTAAGVCTKL